MIEANFPDTFRRSVWESIAEKTPDSVIENRYRQIHSLPSTSDGVPAVASLPPTLTTTAGASTPATKRGPSGAPASARSSKRLRANKDEAYDPLDSDSISTRSMDGKPPAKDTSEGRK